jgi:hypothetical protein
MRAGSEVERHGDLVRAIEEAVKERGIQAQGLKRMTVMAFPP